jgi:hypothetical protein
VIRLTLFPHDDSVTRAVESWSTFADVMSTEDKIEFEKMMHRCFKYARSIEVKAEPFENEAIFMALLFEQDKIIRWLLAKVEVLER